MQWMRGVGKGLCGGCHHIKPPPAGEASGHYSPAAGVLGTGEGQGHRVHATAVWCEVLPQHPSAMAGCVRRRAAQDDTG